MRSLQILKLLFLATFLLNGVLASAQCPRSLFEGVHVVQANETLFKIAQDYNVSVDQICTWNSINKTKPLRECKALVVSAALVNPLPENRWIMSKNGKVVKQESNWHTVRVGESLENIARTYGYTAEKFREINDLSNWTVLKPGAIVRSSECACAPESIAASRKAKTTPTEFSNTSVQRLTPSAKAVEERGYMTLEESSMIDEINLMRANPAAYIKHIDAYVKQQKNEWNYTVSPSALKSLKNDLRKSPKLSTLKAHKCLYQMAKTHGEYLARTNQFSHSGPNGKGPWSRTMQTCPQVKLSTSKNRMGNLVGNENLVAGNKTARESVINLLLDEGLNPPGHRETLLAPEWNYVACYNYGEWNGMPNAFIQNFGR